MAVNNSNVLSGVGNWTYCIRRSMLASIVYLATCIYVLWVVEMKKYIPVICLTAIIITEIICKAGGDVIVTTLFFAVILVSICMMLSDL